MAHPFAVLLLALAVTVLVAGPALAGDIERANELIDEANALLDEHNALDGRAGELLDEAFAIDPASADAVDALPLLEEAEAILATMKGTMSSIAALWVQAGDLAETAEQAAYASQQEDIAKTHVEAHVITGELLSRYMILYDSREMSELTEAELEALDREFTELGGRSEELYGRVEEMELAAERYYTENDLDAAVDTGGSPAGLLVSLLVASGSALGCAAIARGKNRSVVGWGIFGFFIPIAALVGVAVVKKLEPPLTPASQAAGPPPPGAGGASAPAAVPPPPDAATAAAGDAAPPPPNVPTAATAPSPPGPADVAAVPPPDPASAAAAGGAESPTVDAPAPPSGMGEGADPDADSGAAVTPPTPPV
jgi:hypothetical protein